MSARKENINDRLDRPFFNLAKTKRGWFMKAGPMSFGSRNLEAADFKFNVHISPLDMGIWPKGLGNPGQINVPLLSAFLGQWQDTGILTESKYEHISYMGVDYLVETMLELYQYSRCTRINSKENRARVYRIVDDKPAIVGVGTFWPKYCGDNPNPMELIKAALDIESTIFDMKEELKSE